MKKLKNLPILCLTLTLLLGACAEDRAVTDKATRDRILAQQKKSSNRGQSQGSSSLRFEGSAVAVNLTERLVEALKYSRFALGLEENTRLKISGSPEILKVDNSDLRYNNGFSDYNYVEDKELQVLVHQDDSQKTILELSTIIEMKNNARTGQDELTNKVLTEKASQLVTKSREVNFVINDYKFILSEDETDADKLNFSLKMNGRFNASMLLGKSGKLLTGTESYEYVLSGKIERGSLKQDSVVVTGLVGHYRAMKTNPAEGAKFEVVVQPSDLQINLGGPCAVVDGTLKLNYSRKEFALSFSDKEIVEESTKGQFRLAKCDGRPTIDLTKILEPIGKSKR